jgi:RimJ/RimL family protein N-acetyltransferase
MTFHLSGAPVPEEKRTDRLLLRPLRASDVALDYDAVMSDPAALRRWSQTSWPADDFTLAENLADLERHEREHREGLAFTFTVLSPDQARCLGCVYMRPPRPEVAALVPGTPHTANVEFWVRASEVASDLDRHLLLTLCEWLASEWAFDRVLYTIGESEERQAALLSAAGLERLAEPTLSDGRRCLVFA